MRLNNRIKQPFWYASYGATVADTDEYGNQIGTSVTYSNPVKAYANISAARGEVVARLFGEDDLYDKQIVIEDRDTPIDEHAVLWIDEEPELDANGALAVKTNGDVKTPHNYIVRKVGRGIPKFGFAVLAVSKVTVT